MSNYKSQFTGEEVDERLALAEQIPLKQDKEEGKGLSSNDYTNEDKSLLQTILNKVDENEFNEYKGQVENTIASLHEQIGVVEDNIDEVYAKQNGRYSDMSVGMADNLVGRGDVQDALINFRPSGGVLGVGNGMNITDGAARIERIKGNSVVWNQLCDFENGRFTFGSATGVKVANGYTITTSSTSENKTIFQFPSSIPFNNCKWLAIAIIKSPITVNIKGISSYGFIPDTKCLVYTFYSATNNNNWYWGLSIGETGITATINVYDYMLVNLTKMFGASNEPSTIEDFYARIPSGIDTNIPNEGELIDMKVNSLISTSDNAYDYVNGYARVMGGHTYDCSYGTAFVEKVYFSTDKNNIVAEENAMTSENGEYTFPSDGYAVPYTTDGDVREYCVCLQHSYDKPHPPYQQEVKDLSFIGEVFPEGMRSVGSAFDEIRFNKTTKVWEKIVRVGVRAYAEGDAEDSSVTTDGKTTNYPLANPTPTPIDLSPNFNPDYLVWDFGTEEAVASEPSAPFRADINYEPNAVDDLRWAVAEIRSLRAELAQLQSAQASETNLME